MTPTDLTPNGTTLSGTAPPAVAQPSPPTDRAANLSAEGKPLILFAQTRSFFEGPGQWLHEDAVGFWAGDANLCPHVETQADAAAPSAD